MTSDQKSPLRNSRFMTSEQKSTIRKTFMISERWNEAQAHLNRMQHMQDNDETIYDDGNDSDSFNPKYLS